MRRLMLLALVAMPLAAHAQTMTPQDQFQSIIQGRSAAVLAQTQAQVAQARQKATADAAAAMSQPKMQAVTLPPTTK